MIKVNSCYEQQFRISVCGCFFCSSSTALPSITFLTQPKGRELASWWEKYSDAEIEEIGARLGVAVLALSPSKKVKDATKAVDNMADIAKKGENNGVQQTLLSNKCMRRSQVYFNKDEFVKRNKENNVENAYDALEDFLYVEIRKHNYEEIIELLTWENIKEFFYEGNQYSIVKRQGDSESVIISDEVALEYGVSNNQARFQIEISGLVELIEAAGKKSEI